MSFTPMQTTVPAQPKQGRGCFFYGCVTSIVLLIGIIIAVYFGFRYAISHFVGEYTESDPRVLAPVDHSVAAYRNAKERLTNWVAAVKNGQPSGPFTLSESDLNTLVTSYPGMEESKDRLYLSLKQDTVQVVLSLPLGELDYPGRFLNGSGIVKPVLVDGTLKVFLKSVELRGTSLSDTILSQFKDVDLIQKLEIQLSPEAKEFFEKIERLEVKPGELIFHPKTAAPK